MDPLQRQLAFDEINGSHDDIELSPRRGDDSQGFSASKPIVKEDDAGSEDGKQGDNKQTAKPDSKEGKQSYIDNLEKQLLETQAKQRELINELKAESIMDRKVLPYGGETPQWRKKKVRKIGVHVEKKVQDEEDKKSEGSVDSQMPGTEPLEDPDAECADGQEVKKKVKKNKTIQESLRLNSDHIPVASEKPIKPKHWENYFKYLIYDGYRPQTLAHARDYIDFLIRDPQESDPSFKTPQHILDYMSQELKTVLPGEVDESRVLDFDQNFECGNLDSVYFVTLHEYNLLMKVDTNTRGNTYWFHFKVNDFTVGQRYKFNLFNFTRNLDSFYKQGMNIAVKAEKKEKVKNIKLDEEGKEQGIDQPVLEEETNNDDDSEELDSDDNSEKQRKDSEDATNFLGLEGWRLGLCSHIDFQNQGEIVRTYKKNPDNGENVPAKYYSRLSFSYTFRPEDQGCTVSFAYSVPYGYTDLIQDLDFVKNNLLKKDPLDPSKQDIEYKVIQREDYFDTGYGNHANSLAPPINPNFALDDENQIGQQDQGQGGPLTVITAKEKMRQVINNKGGFRVPDERSPELKVPAGQKLSQYQMQHMSIKKEGIEGIRRNQFEIKYNEEFAKMQQDISLIQRRNQKRDQNFEIINKFIHYRQEVIGQSICGLNIYQLTLTKRKEWSIKPKKKSVIFIQARLHAAETHGSIIMKFLMHDLILNSEKYDKILSNYVIKLVPMINPDGVVIGNSRSSLTGIDLNRRWSDPNATMHPEIYFLKNHMKLIEKQCAGISIFCDLHGHNKQLNTFIYGCNKAPNEGILSWTKTRLLPKIIASIEPIFDFKHCQFSQEKQKYNTARVVVWNEMKVTNSFTLETSMFGKKLKSIVQKNQNHVNQKVKFQISQLSLMDLKSIAVSLLRTFTQYTELEVQLEKEFKATGGWLKKKKLDQMTGETARYKQELQNQQQLQKQGEKKKVTAGYAGNGPRKSQTTFILPSSTQLPHAPTTIKEQQQEEDSEEATPDKKATITQDRKKSFRGGNQQSFKLTQPALANNQPEAKNTTKNSKSKPIRLKTQGNLSEAIKKESKESKKQPSKEKGRSSTKIKEESRVDSKSAASSQQVSLNWHQFFQNNEFENAIIESQQPKSKEKQKQKPEQKTQESDSEPSCDNFNEQEIAERFAVAVSDDEKEKMIQQAKKKDEEVQQLKKIERKKTFSSSKKPVEKPQPQVQLPNPLPAQSHQLQQKEFQMIVREMEGVKKETKKLQNRFDLLAKQIRAKIKQDQQNGKLDGRTTYQYQIYTSEQAKQIEQNVIAGRGREISKKDMSESVNFSQISNLSPVKLQQNTKKFLKQRIIGASSQSPTHPQRSSSINNNHIFAHVTPQQQNESLGLANEQLGGSSKNVGKAMQKEKRKYNQNQSLKAHLQQQSYLMRHSLDPAQSILNTSEKVNIFKETAQSGITSQQMVQIQNSIEQNVFDSPDLQKILQSNQKQRLQSKNCVVNEHISQEDLNNRHSFIIEDSNQDFNDYHDSRTEGEDFGRVHSSNFNTKLSQSTKKGSSQLGLKKIESGQPYKMKNTMNVVEQTYGYESKESQHRTPISKMKYHHSPQQTVHFYTQKKGELQNLSLPAPNMADGFSPSVIKKSQLRGLQNWEYSSPQGRAPQTDSQNLQLVTNPTRFLGQRAMREQEQPSKKPRFAKQMDEFMPQSNPMSHLSSSKEAPSKEYYDSSYFNQKNLQDYPISQIADQRLGGGDGMAGDNFARVVKMPPIGKSELRINNSFEYKNDPSQLAVLSAVAIQNNSKYENQQTLSNLKSHLGISDMLQGDFSQSSNYESYLMQDPRTKLSGISSPDTQVKKKFEKQSDVQYMNISEIDKSPKLNLEGSRNQRFSCRFEDDLKQGQVRPGEMTEHVSQIGTHQNLSLPPPYKEIGPATPLQYPKNNFQQAELSLNGSPSKKIKFRIELKGGKTFSPAKRPDEESPDLKKKQQHSSKPTSDFRLPEVAKGPAYLQHQSIDSTALQQNSSSSLKKL